MVPRGLDLARIPFLCSEGLVFSPQAPCEMNCCLLASLTRNTIHAVAGNWQKHPGFQSVNYENAFLFSWIFLEKKPAVGVC